MEQLEQLAALDQLSEEPFSPAEGVQCRVCGVEVSVEDGTPLHPVGPEAVEAVQLYVSEAGSAEEGGVELVAPGPTVI